MLAPGLEADHATIVDLVNLAYRGQRASWNVETGATESPCMSAPAK